MTSYIVVRAPTATILLPNFYFEEKNSLMKKNFFVVNLQLIDFFHKEIINIYVCAKRE